MVNLDVSDTGIDTDIDAVNVNDIDIKKKHTKNIKQRLKEFGDLGLYGKTTFNFKPYMDLILNATLKTELLFCISTANSSAKSGLLFQKSLEKLNVEELSAQDIEELMQKAGVRFSKRKAEYARKAIEKFEIVEAALSLPDLKARDLLVKNIKGLGFKEASHFLRNIGKTNLTIVDRHVLRWLAERGYISEVKTLTQTKYKKIEKILREIAKSKNISLAELDLIIWFEKTGKVLK